MRLQTIVDAVKFSFAAVSIDGVQVFEFSSTAIDPDGWYSQALNAGPNAPFDIPFYFVLYVV